jgi:hypothetical protein
MARKAFVPPRIAPLQRVTAEPITDPAEQAAVDRMRRRIKDKLSRQQSGAKRRGSKAAPRNAARKRT